MLFFQLNHLKIHSSGSERQFNLDGLQFFTCLFVWDPQPHFSHGVNSQGRTYGDDPYHPGHLSPQGLVSLSVPSPPPPPPPRTFAMHPASGLYPPLSSCPVHITYRVSGLSLPCFHVRHIYSNPTERNPLTHTKPHIQTVLIHYFNKQTIKTAEYHYLVSPPVSSVPTCSNAPHLHQ